MAKSDSNQATSTGRAATKAFERAWKLLGRLEKRLAAARKAEAKRRRQLAEATGPDVARRQEQLDSALADAAHAAGLLTELSELIAANARAQARQTVSDMAHEAAQAVRSEARAKTAAGPGSPPAAAAKPVGRPRRSAPTAKPATRATRSTAARPAGKDQPAATPPAAEAPGAASAKPAAKPRRTRAASAPGASPRATAAARPRTRRSLQPGSTDPDQSSS
jgi:chemotaxis protein histidine kinase CheA